MKIGKVNQFEFQHWLKKELLPRGCDGASCECEVGYDTATYYQCEHCTPDDYEPETNK